MKKTLLMIAVSAMMLNTVGCGTCRNLLCRNRTTPPPMMTQSMPACAPVCPPVCSDGISGSPVMYGHSGSMPGIMSGGMMPGGMMSGGMMMDGCECQ